MLLFFDFIGIIINIIERKGIGGKEMKKSVRRLILGGASLCLAVTGGLMVKATVEETTQAEVAPVVTLLENKGVKARYDVPGYWNERERKVVYLTFDDGPSNRTTQILDILKEYDVQGTFFFTGTQIEGKESIVKKVDEAGHYVGMHSISHSVNELYNSETPDNLSNELIQMQDMIMEITGKRPILFRPPYGSMPHMNKTEIIESLVSNGFRAWDWTLDTEDWSVSSASQIMNIVENTFGDKNEVVLMHEKAVTVEALPSIIKFYRDNGYEFRSYDEDLHTVCNFLKDDRL